MMDRCTFLGFKISTLIYSHYKVWKSQDIFFNITLIAFIWKKKVIHLGWLEGVNYGVIFIFGWTIPLMMDLFLTSFSQLFASQDVYWWTGVMWITCGSLWCFISCSDGTHLIKRISWFASDVICSHEEAHFLMKRWTQISKLWFLGELFL